MGKTKKIGLGGGLKARYGSTVRKRYVEVVQETRKRHPCPKCSSPSVKRESVGIWKCRKCGFTFTGGAYVPSTKLGASTKRAQAGFPEKTG